MLNIAYMYLNVLSSNSLFSLTVEYDRKYFCLEYKSDTRVDVINDGVECGAGENVRIVSAAIYQINPEGIALSQETMCYLRYPPDR